MLIKAHFFSSDTKDEDAGELLITTTGAGIFLNIYEIAVVSMIFYAN